MVVHQAIRLMGRQRFSHVFLFFASNEDQINDRRLRRFGHAFGDRWGRVAGERGDNDMLDLA
jgi:hypothetical protein